METETPVVPDVEIVVSGGPEAPPAEDTPKEPAAAKETPDVESPEEETPSKPAAKDRLQKRFSELTRTIHAERARAEAAERALAEAKARSGGTPPAHESTSGEGAPKIEDFKDYESYADARARWVAQQEYQRLSAAQVQQAQRQRASQMAADIQSRWMTNEEAARKQFGDYDEVIADPEVRFPESVALALLDSEMGPQVTYYLKKHPEEARKLTGLTPVAAARQIGKLEAKLTASSPTTPTSKTPAPPSPVKPKAPADGLSDSLSDADWIRRRNKEVMEKRRNA